MGYLVLYPWRLAMRTLVVGLQSSGASWVTFNLVQQYKPMVSVIDLFSGHCIPRRFRRMRNCIVKCKIGVDVTVDDVARAMKPHRMILVQRNINDTVASLKNKAYADNNGQLDEKIRLYREICDTRMSMFDEIIHYECFQPLPVRYTVADILLFNCDNSRWCAKTYTRAWGFGALRDVPRTSMELYA